MFGRLPLSVGFGVAAIIDRLFSSRRLGEWKPDASLKAVADDLAAYLNEKGWVVVDERRRRFIRSVPLWAKFLDPLLFTSDGRNFVLRSNWDEIYVVEIKAGGVRWSVRPSTREECVKYDGMKSLLSELYNEYFEISVNLTNRAKSEKQYVEEWASHFDGKDVDKAWLQWMRVCASPNEAFAWADLNFGPESIGRWLALGIGITGVQEWLQVGASVEDAEGFIRLGWTSSEAGRSIKRRLNL
jgi:hypothetical protein